MRTSASQLARLALLLAVAGWLLPAGAADAKPDRKKSQAAMLRGRKATMRGSAPRRSRPIPRQSRRMVPMWKRGWRAAAITRPRATARSAGRFRPSHRDAAGGAENYQARGDFFAAIGQAERAIHDYSLAINLKLERTEVYTARGKAYTEVRQFEKAEEDFTQAISCAWTIPNRTWGVASRAPNSASTARRWKISIPASGASRITRSAGRSGRWVSSASAISPTRLPISTKR